MGAASPEATRRKKKQPWVKVEVTGAGGILVFGGILIAAAFAAFRARRRRSPAAAAINGAHIEKERASVSDGEEDVHGETEHHNLEISQEEISGYVNEIREVEEPQLDKSQSNGNHHPEEQKLEKSELVSVKDENEDEEMRQTLDKTKLLCLNLSEEKEKEIEALLPESPLEDKIDKMDYNLFSSHFIQVQGLEKKLPPNFSHPHSCQESEFNYVKETKAAEEAPVLSIKPQEGEEDYSSSSCEEGEVEMDQLGSDATASSSSASSESNAEAIWPAEVLLEPEKTLPSEEVNNLKKREVDAKCLEESKERRREPILRRALALALALALEKMNTSVLMKKMTSTREKQILLFKGLLAALVILGLLISTMDSDHLYLGHFQKLCHKFSQSSVAATEDT